MRQRPSDRLLFFDDEDAGETTPDPAGAERPPNRLGAALFLLGIVLALAAALGVVVAWHVVRMR